MEVQRLAIIQRSMMKKWTSLYDLCPVGSGTRNDRTVRITAMAYLKNCPDNAQQMEKQLLCTSEYILLRGKHGGGYGGLLREVNVCATSRITGQAIADLYDSVPRTYQQKAVFLMNVATLNVLRCALGADAHDWITSRRDGSLLLMDKPVMLCNAMPYIRKGSVPILFGDFSKVSIKDCGRDELQQEPCNGSSDRLLCTMTGYMNCALEDKRAIWGLKII